MITVTAAKKIPHESEQHRDSSCWYRDCSGARPKSRHGRDERFHQRFPKQRGIVIPFVAIAMLALLGMTGLALDMGHAYLNKTRVQNALDAAALSAAKTLDQTASTTQADTAGTAAFNQTLAANGNQEMAGLTVAFTYSHQLNPFPTAGTPVFVRARLGGAGVFTRPSWLIQVLGFANVSVAGSAVAGPSPTINQNLCNVIPVMACGTPGIPDFGYTPGSTWELKTGSGSKDWDVGPGNYQNIELGCGPGGACVRDGMAGAYDQCLISGNSVNTKPGNNVGPNAQGMNTRFGCPPPGCGPLKNDPYYPPDKVTDAGASGYPDTNAQYKTDYTNQNWDYPNGGEQRRVVVVPVGNCTGTTNGAGSVPLLGFACFFLTQPAEHNGKQTIYGEFLSKCEAQGVPGSTPSLTGPTKIILYKDFSTGPTVPDA